MEFLISAFLFFLPAGVANATPVFANRIPWLRRWKTPLDLGKSWRGIRLMGDNKTWRGLISGTVMGGVTSLLTSYFFIPNSGDPLFIFLVGAALGAGALTGDAVESFVKRRRGVMPGKSWFPFDQTDYIIGGLVFVYPLTFIPFILMIAILLLYFGLHLLVGYLGFLLGFKQHPI
ncbi:CDP-archaeol synthase [Candidatus Saccharibacteria bacterium]|nr:CDP-archaeol synthase [Candidatus Saccharibacteria bacterium]